MNIASPAHIADLKKYMSNTWVGRIVGDRYIEPRYGLELWSCHESTLRFKVRTNNHHEAWHKTMRKTLGTDARPQVILLTLLSNFIL